MNEQEIAVLANENNGFYSDWAYTLNAKLIQLFMLTHKNITWKELADDTGLSEREVAWALAGEIKDSSHVYTTVAECLNGKIEQVGGEV